MKRKKTGDQLGWKAEWIKKGGGGGGGNDKKSCCSV